MNMEEWKGYTEQSLDVYSFFCTAVLAMLI